MSDSMDYNAWNNFVMNDDAENLEKGNSKHVAFIAKNYMNTALGGGINSFLTNSWDLDAKDVLKAVKQIGALIAAKELEHILAKIAVPIPVSSQDARWDLMEKHWPEELNEHDFLSDEAEKDLMLNLEEHVRQNEEFYLSLE
jgi:hypothetical protein